MRQREFDYPGGFEGREDERFDERAGERGFGDRFTRQAAWYERGGGRLPPDQDVIWERRLRRGSEADIGQGPFSGRGPRGYRRSDERIFEEVCERLTIHGGIDATDIDVEVAKGVVTLTGAVADRRQKRMAEEAIEDITGVEDVNNHLRLARAAEGRPEGKVADSDARKAPDRTEASQLDRAREDRPREPERAEERREEQQLRQEREAVGVMETDARSLEERRQDAAYDRIGAQRTDAQRSEAQRIESERSDAQKSDAERSEALRREAQRSDAERSDAQRTQVLPPDLAARSGASSGEGPTGSEGTRPADTATVSPVTREVRLQTGTPVYSREGDKIGEVADGSGEYFVVHKGLIFASELYFPASSIVRSDENGVLVDISKDDISNYRERPTAAQIG